MPKKTFYFLGKYHPRSGLMFQMYLTHHIICFIWRIWNAEISVYFHSSKIVVFHMNQMLQNNIGAFGSLLRCKYLWIDLIRLRWLSSRPSIFCWNFTQPAKFRQLFYWMNKFLIAAEFPTDMQQLPPTYSGLSVFSQLIQYIFRFGYRTVTSAAVSPDCTHLKVICNLYCSSYGGRAYFPCFGVNTSV